MSKISRRRFLKAAGGALLLPALAHAGIVNISGPRRFVTTPPVNGLQFPLTETGYMSAVPGMAGFGFDSPVGSGRGTSNQVAKFYIDDRGTGNTGSARPELGPRCYSGTFEYCWRANTFLSDGTSPMSKSIIPLIDGWVWGSANIPMQTGTPPRGGFFNYLGQYQPPAGLWFRGMRPHTNGASDWMVMHMRSFIGDDDAGLGADNRDPFGSGYSGGVTQRGLYLFNEDGFSVDELTDMYWEHDLISVIGCLFGPALMDSRINHTGDPEDEPHGFGPYIGGGAQAGSILWARNALGYTMGRNPMTSASRLAFANNFHYDVGGRPGGGNAEGLDILASPAPATRIADIVHNWWVRGPDNNATPVTVRVRSGSANDASCRGGIIGNAAHGWTLANQAAFVNTSLGSYVQSTLQGGLPNSWNGLASVLQETPSTSAEWHAVIDLVEKYVGAGLPVAGTPKARLIQHARNRIDGGSTSFQFVDTVQQWTGNANINDPYWTVSNSSPINPNDPPSGSGWIGPIPNGEDVDTPVAGGTFTNGMSADGRSPFERHYLEQHYSIMRARGVAV